MVLQVLPLKMVNERCILGSPEKHTGTSLSLSTVFQNGAGGGHTGGSRVSDNRCSAPPLSSLGGVYTLCLPRTAGDSARKLGSWRRGGFGVRQGQGVNQGEVEGRGWRAGDLRIDSPPPPAPPWEM